MLTVITRRNLYFFSSKKVLKNYFTMKLNMNICITRLLFLNLIVAIVTLSHNVHFSSFVHANAFVDII